MTRLWCVKGKLNDGEIYLRADAVEISPHGEIASYRENGAWSLVLAPRPWRLDGVLRGSSRRPRRVCACLK